MNLEEYIDIIENIRVYHMQWGQQFCETFLSVI